VKILRIEETYISTSGKNFRIIFENWIRGMLYKFISWEEAQNNKLWESYHLEIQILVRPGKGRSSEQT
jgi:hypothetical protein